MMSKTEKHIEYWSNGQKKREGTYKNGKHDGNAENIKYYNVQIMFVKTLQPGIKQAEIKSA